MKRIRKENINTGEHFDKVFQASPELYDSYQNIEFYNTALNLHLFDGQYTDYGCGNGEPLYKASTRHHLTAVMGVDISSSIIETNKQKYPSITFMTVDEYMNKNLEADTIISTHTFEHVEDPHTLAQQLLKRARKRFFIIVPYKDSWKECDEHVWRYDRHSFDSLDPSYALPGITNRGGNTEILYFWDKEKKHHQSLLTRMVFFIKKIPHHSHRGLIKKYLALLS